MLSMLRAATVAAIAGAACALVPRAALADDPKPALPATAPAPAVAAPAAPVAGAPSAGAAAPAAPSAAGDAKAPETYTITTTPAKDITQLAWMHGCWSGKVNNRDFTEQWTAPAAGMMLGLGHTVMGGKTESFEFMRLETGADGKVSLVMRPVDRVEDVFTFDTVKTERDVEFYIFNNGKPGFPARIAYAHASRGRMFVHVQGKVNGADREVIYPFVPVDCVSGKSLL